MAGHSPYPREVRIAAVAEAERTTIKAAAHTTGIPRKTIGDWMKDPEMAEVRQSTRDKISEGSVMVAHLALGEIARRIMNGTIDDRSLVMAYGVAVDKAQLLAGMATSRSESRDISNTYADAELAAIIREAERITGEARTPTEAEGTPEG